MCLALNKRACTLASSAMQKRISRKYYVALLRGHVSVNSMDLTMPIGKMFCNSIMLEKTIIVQNV